MGWYLAEGSSTKGGVVQWTLGISEKEKNNTERIVDLLGDVFGLEPMVIDGDHSTSVVLKNKTLAYVFREWFGHDARVKKIPTWMYQASLPCTKSVLKGLWAGDGYRTYSGPYKSPVLGLNTGSVQLSLDICSMLLKLGIRPHLHPHKAHPDSFTKRTMYHIRVYGRDYERLLATLSNERVRSGLKERRKTHSFIEDGMYWFPLGVDRMRYSGPVFDLLNVSNGSSYVLGNLTVHNSEDFYFSKRAREAGFRIVVDTSIVCRHMGPVKILPSYGSQGLFEFRSPGNAYTDL